MNQQKPIAIEKAQAIPRLRRGPQIARSAVFIIGFVTAISLTVIGTLFSFSEDPARSANALSILMFNMALIAILGGYLGYRTWSALFASAKRQSAPLLHRRFVLIFSLAALTPAVIVGAFSTSLITQNINDLFGSNVRSNIESARTILGDYVEQEMTELGRAVRTVKSELNRRPAVLKSRISYTADLQVMSRVRDLDAVYIIKDDGYVLTRVESPSAPLFEIPLPAVFDGLEEGEVAFQRRDDLDYLIAVTKLENYDQTYLYVGQLLQSESPVLSSLTGIADATREIDKFANNQALMGRIFLLAFIQTALLILFAAVWLGLGVANRIINPLGRLINAAERIRAGDMDARVDVGKDWGEMSDLGSAFNRMTNQLNSQRAELVKEHDISEQRRQFSEAVLSGVRAGVIGLTQSGRITLMNQSASLLLGADEESLLGYPIEDVLFEFAPAFKKARESILSTAEDQVNFQADSGIRNFDLRVSAYQGMQNDTGWVLTFDDMTRLVSAQRHSAWREVARRIAHEIKNPLTPIQLSAERLLRKYSKEISTDPEVFENCTQTIIRQVESLEQMVNEFSAFARMPAPSFAPVPFFKLVEDILFAQGVAFPDIDFTLSDEFSEDTLVMCDKRLINQALTNIYKNAAESVLRRVNELGADEHEGIIKTELSVKNDKIEILISDNGMGWPVPDKERLLEPYVTTRDSGTGLGLAIVMRIAADHGGGLSLHEKDDGKQGAVIKLNLPQGELANQALDTQNLTSQFADLSEDKAYNEV